MAITSSTLAALLLACGLLGVGCQRTVHTGNKTGTNEPTGTGKDVLPLTSEQTEAHKFFVRGFKSFQNREFAIAIQELDNSLRLDPSNAVALACRGRAWLETGDFDRALRDFDEAVRLDPKEVVALQGRGVVWFKKGDFEKAIRDYDEAIRLGPTNITFAMRGDAWRRKGDSEQALRDYSEAVRLGLKKADVFASRAHIWFDRGEYEKAIQDFTEVIRLDPKDTIALANRAESFAAKGDYDKALQDYAEAIRLNPGNVVALCNRALLRARCPDSKYRDEMLALEDAQRACKFTDWKHHHPLATLALVYAESGHFDEAVAWQKKALECPMDPESKSRIQMDMKLYEEKKLPRVQKK